MTNKSNYFECYFDGSITRNPGGDMGIGGVVYEVNNGVRQKIHDFTDKLPAKFFPDGTSCNVAEVLALNKLLAFFLMEEKQHLKIRVYGDSQIVINRAQSGNKNGKGIFIPYVVELVDCIKLFSDIRFQWVPREKNTEADAISR